MFREISLFGIHIDLYSFFNFFGWVVLMVYNFLQLKPKKELLSPISLKIIESKKPETKKIILYCAIVETIILSSVQFFSGVEINKLWGKLITDGSDNYFGFALWATIVFVVVCALFRVAPMKQLDLYTPAYALSLASFKIASFCSGCCYGIEWEYGLYNAANNRVEFPIQLLELLVAICIFVVTHIYGKKKHRVGTVFPLYLILYSATRFCTEFLRDDFPRYFGISTYHIQCLIGVIVGVAEMFFVVEVSNKIKWLNDGFNFKKREKK